jgi:predicted amidohydrolase
MGVSTIKTGTQEGQCMKLAMAQMKNEGSLEKNLAKSIAAIQKSAEQGADLILFPEVHLTEFFPQYPGQNVGSYGIELDSDIVAAFKDACAQNHIAAVPNIYLKKNGKFYDASIFIDKTGKVLGIQKMVHIAQAEQFYEQDYYEPSNTGFQVFDTKMGKIGIVVCFDRHYPESIRTESLMGADLILIPTVNTKSEPLEMFEWEIRVQAFQNSVAIAMCNRVGIEGDMVFAGESLLTDANGNILVKADDSERLIFAEIDLQTVEKVRSEKPYTTLRRKEWYK